MNVAASDAAGAPPLVGAGASQSLALPTPVPSHGVSPATGGGSRQVHFGTGLPRVKIPSAEGERLFVLDDLVEERDVADLRAHLGKVGELLQLLATTANEGPSHLQSVEAPFEVSLVPFRHLVLFICFWNDVMCFPFVTVLF